MNPVLGLPGRNPETEGWMSELLSASGFEGAEIARYRHWQNGSDPDVRSEAIESPVFGRRLVVAKSMGTMVLLAAAEHGDPERAVLIGTPIDVYTDEQIGALQALITRLPCLFVQQTDDFTGSAASLRAVLGSEGTPQELAGSDHVYAEVEELAGLIRSWQERLDG